MKKTILIADNDLNVLEKAKKALESKGFRVETALNGIECLQKLHDGLKPKLIILNAAMPVMSGWRTLYEMHKDKQFAKIKTVLFSSSEFNKRLANTEYSKALEDHYIKKPFTASEISKRVKQLTAR